ncbi:MAG: hypothetical protein ACPGCX_08665 [Ilumatobacteraceae bacterium]
MRRGHLYGWMLFLLSAVIYLVAGIRAGDWLVILGSVVWAVACFVFLGTDGAFRSRDDTERTSD